MARVKKYKRYYIARKTPDANVVIGQIEAIDLVHAFQQFDVLTFDNGISDGVLLDRKHNVLKRPEA